MGFNLGFKGLKEKYEIIDERVRILCNQLSLLSPANRPTVFFKFLLTTSQNVMCFPLLWFCSPVPHSCWCL